ncbi:hypothetical protein SS50377_22313 [Spironucleus salmonicida]|uniref:Exonuclease domain-containing protein n=1 Tax=Spironucleus salmonicida TaxID=348837 RepID=V6LD89_9EUKA|nr:hypothetical protein SS50377_22313 [Spironucleus salmonicida]|eukprot:EST42193.1 Hypothetical protein SS50377_18497 [Spironucleus salmonicida]
MNKLLRNHIFLDFEAYFAQPYQECPLVVPFEIGAIRVQNGEIVAQFHAFILPNSNDYECAVNCVLDSNINWNKPHPNDPNFHLFRPIEITKLGPLFEIFALGSSIDLYQLKCPFVSIQTSFSAHFVDSIIAKDPTLENVVLYHQMKCKNLEGKLIDFDLFSHAFLGAKFSSKQANLEMHKANKCKYHSQKSSSHCALGDARYLAGLFIKHFQ